MLIDSLQPDADVFGVSTPSQPDPGQSGPGAGKQAAAVACPVRMPRMPGVFRALLNRDVFGRVSTAAVGSAERRVALLAIAITIMGLTDLALTLTYMKTTGMYELNPLARAMVAIGGAKQLVIFKLLTLSLSAGVLFLLRRHRIVEPTAWACALIMGALTVHWVSYNNQIENPDVWHGMQLAMGDKAYVLINTQ